MRIGILGTGTLASGLGRAWSDAGHELVIGGRDPGKARALAERLEGPARGATLREAAVEGDAVLLAVLWNGIEDVVRAAGGDGTLAGKPLIDPTNAVEHGVGELLTPPGSSAAERIAALAVGAHVVKAFHLFPADRWTQPYDKGLAPPTVPLCGDNKEALETVAGLVADAHGVPVVLGPLTRARQLEETAGFVMGLAFQGANPATAVPSVEPSML